jgi:predicted neuraminidase
MPPNFKRIALLLVTLAVFAFAWLSIESPEPARFAMPAPIAGQTDAEPRLETSLISGGLTNEAHSSTAVELGNGDIAAFWYAGTREGSADVAIYGRYLRNAADPAQATWSDVEVIIDREIAIDGLHRHVRKIGNPVAVYHDDKIWLFVVTVSLGGWSGSSISLMQSADQGQTWTAPRRLVTSPFLNLSTLVRGAGVALEDGGLILPVYHQMFGKFSELLRLDTEGRPVGKYRVSHGQNAIQPVLVPLDASKAVVFMRNATDEEPSAVLASLCDRGGAQCTSLHAINLPNPNAAVSSVSLDRPDELLMVLNNDTSSRDDLTLAYTPGYVSDGGGAWEIIHHFEKLDRSSSTEDIEHNPYSYPFLVKTRGGDFHLFYTWRKTHIKHAYFNRSALNAMLTDPQRSASGEPR